VKVTLVPKGTERLEEATVVVVMPVALPTRLTVCALSAALSKNVRVAAAAAACFGVNVMLTEQVAFDAIAALLHEFALIANSVEFVPESAIPLGPKIKFAGPLFVTVIDWGVLVVLSIWLKVRLAAESVTAGAGAVGFTMNTVPQKHEPVPPTVVVP
jgi:hypothetical protein